MESKKFYYNITRPIIETFLKYSEEFELKRKRTKVKPIVESYYNSSCQIDLVDYSSIPDHSVSPPYKYVLCVQDHLTKFVHLRPCFSKEGLEVAKHLYQIFCEFGALLLLQSDIGLEFRNK